MNRPPIIRPETCGHFFLFARTRCVWCGVWHSPLPAPELVGVGFGVEPGAGVEPDANTTVAGFLGDRSGRDAEALGDLDGGEQGY